MQIRQAQIHDAPQLAAIAVCVWLDTYAVHGVTEKICRYVFSELTQNKMQQHIADNAVFVAETQDGPVGYMVLAPKQDDRVEIETLYILPGFQGRGLGSEMITTAQNWAGCTLWTSVWDKNDKAIAFYKKCGFMESGETVFDLYGEQIRNLVQEWLG